MASSSKLFLLNNVYMMRRCQKEFHISSVNMNIWYVWWNNSLAAVGIDIIKDKH